MIPKFRAWDKETKAMNGMAEIYRNRNQEIELHPRDENIILMQSTGLLDKNNKEIFEGDIVLVLDSLYTVFYDIEKGSYRLKPHDERWNVDYMSNFSHGGNFEVVGNIYENKELIDA